jgi:hypothetical protein
MKLPATMKSAWRQCKPNNPLEATLMVTLFGFLLFAKIPIEIANWVCSTLGMSIVAILGLYLVSQVSSRGLALVIIIATIEIVRRSFQTIKNTDIQNFNYDGRTRNAAADQSEGEKAKYLANLNPMQPISLEETIINREAPIGVGSVASFGPASQAASEVGFLPVQSNTKLIPSDNR